MMNLVVIAGNLGSDPELRYTASGLPVCNLRIATNEQIRKSDGSFDKHTEWHDIVVFGKRAQAVANYKKKGQSLLVRGHLRTSSWTDNNNQQRWRTRIHAETVEF